MDTRVGTRSNPTERDDVLAAAFSTGSAAAGTVRAAGHMCDRGKGPHPGVATRHPAQQVGNGVYEQ
jgi:hypothetical protein